MRIFLLFLLFVTASMLSSPTALAIGHADLVIATNDGPRHVLVFAMGKGRHPTVIVLHGKSATAAEIAGSTGFV